MFSIGSGNVNRVPDLVTRREYWGDDPTTITDGGPFVVTNVNCTPALNSIGGVPMVQLAGAGAGTDAHQVQVRLDGLRPQGGKILRQYFQFRSADLASHEFGFGFSVLDTSILATNPTDVIGIRKLTTATKFTAFARKASGTEETSSLGGLTLENDLLYDGCLEILRDPATAGKGVMNVYLGASLTAGGLIPHLGAFNIATQLPDTVDLAASRAWRAGGAVTTIGYLGCWGWTVER